MTPILAKDGQPTTSTSQGCLAQKLGADRDDA